jgi:carbon storage regulator
LDISINQHYNVDLEVTEMLVLTRTPAQAVMIGNDVVLTVLAVKGDRVRLGIEAPREIPVLRQEGTRKPPAEPPPR